MSPVFDVGTYFPERPPTWAEVVTTLLVTATVVPEFLDDTVSLPIAVAGFVLFALAVGPGANSSIGQRVGQWFRDIGKHDRALAIFVFLVTMAVLSLVAEALVVVLADAAAGGMMAVALYVFVHAVRAGGVEGWMSDETG
ncbi:hypothetical protein [Haloarcula salinisoli]|uniref:Uncharacterized protein n=1 Tax=Haloarcula salinisoli TaxID=2487746 RepID=A0A8J7YN12_9EURY|nr:hypothetical protein [Halomicroarcula salinisoli]MBX0286891.1 hypothetical protein [Halomicroarcula salinisoli]MBX0304193.1 hypothetical protein [Halomicroarcula salinisoli]